MKVKNKLFEATNTNFSFMDNTETTRRCGQCHRDIAETNFALHESHCSRFLSVCPDCEETVPREKLKEHREEQHALVKCPRCHKKMEKWLLQDHESEECVERLLLCDFCDLEVVWKDLAEHREVCGSRTELCEDCGRYVRLKDRQEHSQTCSSADQNPGAAPLTAACSRCLGSFPARDINKHEAKCSPSRKEEPEEDDGSLGAAAGLSKALKATSRTRPHLGGFPSDGEDPHEVMTCPFCHLALPVSTLRWHQVKCQSSVLRKQREA